MSEHFPEKQLAGAISASNFRVFFSVATGTIISMVNAMACWTGYKAMACWTA